MEESSILDKVLSSKQVTDIENFHPSDILASLFKELTQKEAETLASRFGLRNQEKQTLEEIGKRFAVTRERVRQIEEGAIQKITTQRTVQSILGPTEELIREILETHGGAMTTDMLLTELFRDVEADESDRRAVLFFLDELLSNRFESIGKADDLHDGWKVKGVPSAVIHEAIEHIVAALEQRGSAATVEQLVETLQQNEYFLAHADKAQEPVIASYLALSPAIGKNPYSEYGLVSWGSVAPKRMNDKIYLVLKKHGKPLHFTEITRMINEIGFDRRKAYPPTVHNELILNDQYVLVGRGMYALKEWGYKPGVVADVLHGILEKAGTPLTRDALVEKVLEQRIVKKNTIHLALADATRFTRLPDGTYQLAHLSAPPTP